MPKQLPAVMLDPQSPVFKTRDAAANAVSVDFAKYPNEQAAVVIKRPDGTFGYSTKVSQADEGFAMRALLPKGFSLAATVHSHPGTDDRGQVFSPDDLQTATQLGVPSFVRFAKDNSIRQYVPGQTKTQKTDLYGSSVKTAVGDPTSACPIRRPSKVPATPALAASGGPTVINRDDPVTTEN